MAIQFTTVPEDDFSKGIDARSAENQILPGFVKDILNADVIERRVRKRKGYESYAGSLPVRVSKLEYIAATTTACFTLDSSVDLDSAVNLEQIRSSPLVVYGRSSNQAVGPFVQGTDNGKYYQKFSIPTRKQLTAPSGTLVIAPEEHGLGTTNIFCNIVEATSLTDRSFEDIDVNSISINESTYAVSLGYTIAQSAEAFVYFADKDPVAGQSYIATLNHTGSGLETFSIPTSTHNLLSFNIVSQLQQDTGTSRLQVQPQELTVATNGDVSISLIADSATTYYLILSAAPVTNVVSGAIAAGASGSIVIPTPDRPWAFFNIYLEQTPGGTKEQVFPDTIQYDAVTNQFNISFTNSSPLARNFIVSYEYGNLRSNILCVQDPLVTVNGVDPSPQLSIWGLLHNEIYASKAFREGWTTHIDSYKRSGEQRLIAGLGGNLFSAQTIVESGTEYLIPSLYPRLSTRSDSDAIIGPVIYDTGDTPARTRGYITTNSGATHLATVTAVEYDTGTGTTKYTISMPGKAILDSAGVPTILGNVISTTAGMEDYISIQDMSYKRHEGTFRITQVVDGVDEIEVYADVPDNSEDYDDSGVSGSAGIFTDQVTWLTESPYIAGDTLLSAGLGDTFTLPVISSSSNISVVSDVAELTQIPGGLIFTGRRTSDVIPTRQALPSQTPSTTNLVRGDVVQLTGVTGQFEVSLINPDSSRSCNIVGDGTLATLTMTSGDTTYLTSGQKILLNDAGLFTGVQTVEDVISTTELTFLSSIDATILAATLVGETIQLDSPVTFQDTTGDSFGVLVPRRWIPVEHPDDTFNTTPDSVFRYFNNNSYTDQPFIRSTMVVDNLHLSNYDDEVMQYDGTSIYRAGLPAWQPGLFVTQETTGATIVTDLRQIAYSAIDAATGKVTIAATNINAIPEGTTIRLTGSLQKYTIRSYDDTNNFIYLDRSLDASVAATGTVSEIGTYKYYMRLNAVDVNNNVVASAVTSSQDLAVELTGNAAVLLKAVGLPSFDNLDYSRIELQIYRTSLLRSDGTVAPVFYLVTTLPLDFDNTKGYVEFRDSFTDTDITQASNLDLVNTALLGAELGINWSEPLRAKYTTSLNNKLILGNIRDFSELDIQIVGDANLSNSTLAGDTLLFLKDGTDTATTTDMQNRVKYEWKNGITGNVSNFAPGTNDFSFDTSVATSAVAGDWIYLTYSTVATTGRILTYSGWWQIASVTGVTVTVNLDGAAVAASYPDRYVIATDPTDVPVLLGTDGNLGQVNGDSFDLFDATRRLALAINATMRQVDRTIVGMEDYTPWILSRSGNDLTTAGRIVVRSGRALDTTLAVKPVFSGYSLFINSAKRTSGVTTLSSTKVFPSRILVSYPNYPTIFDSPTTVLDTDSQSAIDINSADGQEITGILPFFGEAAFGAAQQSQVLVVFKTNSIYLVDIGEKAKGNNAVQRIETEGLGCTAPYSIAVTKKGIMFANESGIYCLRRDQSIEYTGKYLERVWTEQVSLDNLAIAQGHHYGIGRSYKLSVPYTDTTSSSGYIENSQVLRYDHTQEQEGAALGAWGRYDNHPATGWANLGSDAFFGATSGKVYRIRNTGDLSDYRDAASPITFKLDLRPNGFGNTGIRKVIDAVVVSYRVGSENKGTTLSYSLDTEQEYSDTTSFTVGNNINNLNGLGDNVGQDITTISHSLERRRGVYLAIRIENSTLDENIEISGVDYKVGGLETKGIKMAEGTRKK